MGIKDCPENVALPSSYVGSAGSPKKTPSLATWWSRDPSRSPILKQNGPSESRLIQCFSFLVWNDCIYIIYTYSNCLKLHVIIMLLFDYLQWHVTAVDLAIGCPLGPSQGPQHRHKAPHATRCPLWVQLQHLATGGENHGYFEDDDKG